MSDTKHTAQWREMRLGDFISLQRGFDLPEPDRRVGRVPVIGSFGVTGYHDTYRVRGPGVTVGRSGASIGSVHYSEVDYWPHNAALFVSNFHGNDPRFVYYFLQLLDLKAFNSGSAQPSLNRNYIYGIPVRVPPLPVQREIAHILGTLDDKIDLNRKMNATLEAMARALFKSWFVDFDPVRAKAEGRDPAGMDAETAALFPDGFEDSPLGDIPRGWRVGTLGEVAVNVRDNVTTDELSAETAYIGLEHMPRGSIALSDWGHAGDLESNKAAFRRGDLLFGKLRPYFKKVGVAPVDGVCSTDILVIRPKAPEWRSFVLAWISSDRLIDHATAVSSGTRMPRAKWQDLADFPIALPTREVAAEFELQLAPMIDTIIANIYESKTLAEMRDALLPRLMRGELVGV